jgi:hypothetical protein
MSMDEFGDMSRTDDIDRGTEIAMRDTAEHVKRAREASQPERIPDGEGGWIYQRKDEATGVFPIPDCVEDDCGEPLPRLRMEMGRIRCVDCQSKREPKRR